MLAGLSRFGDSKTITRDANKDSIQMEGVHFSSKPSVSPAALFPSCSILENFIFNTQEFQLIQYQIYTSNALIPMKHEKLLSYIRFYLFSTYSHFSPVILKYLNENDSNFAPKNGTNAVSPCIQIQKINSELRKFIINQSRQFKMSNYLFLSLNS